MTLSSKPLEQSLAAIQRLDLEPIKAKLMDAQDGPGWSREYVERMETAYKRFLMLLAKHPGRTIAPTQDLDEFWHAHILDTMKYAADCEDAFGHFVHHHPYSGPRGTQEAARQRDAGAAFQALYACEFGEALPQKAAWCTTATTAWCTAAKPAWCTAAEPLVKSGTAWCTASRPQRMPA